MKIPKIINFVWIGGNPLPEKFQYCIQTWKNLHPDWEINLVTDENIPSLINQELFDSVPGIVLKADILKLELLYRGSVVVDTDMECFKNIEPIIEDLEFFSCGEQTGVIGNAIMGATPKHPSVLKLIKALPASVDKNSDYGPNVISGPVYMTKMLSFDEVYTFGPEYFFPIPPGVKEEVGQSEKYPLAYGLHHFEGSWVDKEDKKNWEEWTEQFHDEWFLEIKK
jgi:mannosyltransferase OCH1-like enzyme